MGEVYDFPTNAPTLLDLSTALEKATDAFVAAIDDEAVAHNAFLKQFHVAYATLEVPATIRSKSAEVSAAGELYAWNLATARKTACQAKCRELESRLSAIQSHVRFVGSQT